MKIGRLSVARKKRTYRRQIKGHSTYESILSLEAIKPESFINENFEADLAEFMASDECPWPLDITTETPKIYATIDAYENLARDTLAKAGLHPPTWREANAMTQDRRLEPEWWAARMLWSAFILRHYIEKGDAPATATAALELQDEVGKLLFAVNFELPSLIGLNASESGSRSRKYTQEDYDAWEGIALALWQKSTTKRISNSKVIDEILRRTGQGEKARSSVRNFVRNLKNQLDNKDP